MSEDQNRPRQISSELSPQLGGGYPDDGMGVRLGGREGAVHFRDWVAEHIYDPETSSTTLTHALERGARMGGDYALETAQFLLGELYDPYRPGSVRDYIGLLRVVGRNTPNSDTASITIDGLYVFLQRLGDMHYGHFNNIGVSTIAAIGTSFFENRGDNRVRFKRAVEALGGLVKTEHMGWLALGELKRLFVYGGSPEQTAIPSGEFQLMVYEGIVQGLVGMKDEKRFRGRRLDDVTEGILDDVCRWPGRLPDASVLRAMVDAMAERYQPEHAAKMAQRIVWRSRDRGVRDHAFKVMLGGLDGKSFFWPLSNKITDLDDIATRGVGVSREMLMQYKKRLEIIQKSKLKRALFEDPVSFIEDRCSIEEALLQVNQILAERQE